MATTGTFRTALNGFNRQDVAAYLESAAARYNTLKEEKTQLQQRCDELEAKLAAAAEAQAKLDSVSELLAQKTAEAEALSAELNGLKAENASLLTRLDAAEERLSRNAEKAAEYDELRERLSTLEVEASRRAVEIERSAEAQALELRKAARQEEAAFNLRRDEASRQFQATLSKAAISTGLSAKLLNGELGQLAASLQDIAASLEKAANSFDPTQNVADLIAAAQEEVKAEEGDAE